ncbi:ScbR family autoregulator-binding transcription factor [Streptomyces lushanensis]|uniref:ScbR family autoregulator-binding transcription factor n=1 Tax=Streptomyces lushanensis TaxID=1434255 RepID=UPI00082F5D60|nr:ScbR family autoregulator-binding transcription factor [Streptomyces lushanensis]
MDDPESRATHRSGGKQERSVLTRKALIRSAAEQFERNGYEKTRLSEVSYGAGVTSGALHFHFHSKPELANAVETAAVRSLYHAAWQGRQAQTSALQTLIDVSHVLARVLHQDVVARAGFRLNCDASERTCLSLRQGWQGCIQQALARAADEEALVEGASPERLARVVMAATTGGEVLARENREWLSRPTITGLWQLVLPQAVAPRALAELRLDGTDEVLRRADTVPPP